MMLVFVIVSMLLVPTFQPEAALPLVIVAAFEDGTPAQGLGLLIVDFMHGTPVAGGRTDATGTTRLSLPDGRYRLQINTDLALEHKPPLLPRPTLAERDGIGIEVGGPLHTLALLVLADGTVMVDPAAASGRDAAGATAIALATAGLPTPTLIPSYATVTTASAATTTLAGPPTAATRSEAAPPLVLIGVVLGLGFVLAVVAALARVLRRTA